MADDPKANGVFPGFEPFAASFAKAWPGADLSRDWQDFATRLLDPRQWLGGGMLEQPFETVLGLPRLADAPDLDRKLLQLLQAWFGMSLRSTQYGAVLAQVWIAAYGDFVKELQASAMAGTPMLGGRELLERWTALVNERLLRAQRSDSLLEAQRRLLDAVLTSRAAERELVEIGAKAADLPTRSELDDVHKTLHAVKRDLRALQRRLAAEEEQKKEEQKEKEAKAPAPRRRGRNSAAGHARNGAKRP